MFPNPKPSAVRQRCGICLALSAPGLIGASPNHVPEQPFRNGAAKLCIANPGVGRARLVLTTLLWWLLGSLFLQMS